MSDTILAIDAGNTRLKWGVHDGAKWILRGVAAIRDLANDQTFGDLLNLPDAAAIAGIAVSNVAGPIVAGMIADRLRPLGKPISFFVAEHRQCGVENLYRNPAQLGSDRWAALIGAHVAAAGAPRAQLVLMSGTALTVDVLTDKGRFLGGIIVPGLTMMRRALNTGTAQLTLVEGEYRTFPTRTIDAITSGAIEACTGAVQRMYTHLSAQVGAAPHCIGSGGAMDVLAPHLPFPVMINDNLVLDGLIAITLAKRH